jgi:tetrahydromethanopterin S-methyltransferase subunit C
MTEREGKAMAAATTGSRHSARPFLLGGLVGLVVGIVIGSLVATLAARTIAAAIRSLRRPAPDAAPPFEYLAQ